MDMEYLNGQMEENIEEIGVKENKMKKEKFMILLKMFG